MRVIALLIVAAVLPVAAFGQKPQDPEARNKRAVTVVPNRPGNSAPRRSQPEANSVPRSGSASARDLEKIERTSVQQMKTTHKANNNLKAGSASAGTHPQNKNKPMKFSYHAPKAAGETNSAKNPPPRPVRSRPETP